jgi:hypothetical protein
MAPNLTRADRVLIAEHVGRLRDLAATHEQFAASRSDKSDCAQTKASALAAAKKTGRLALLIEKLAGLL